MLKFLKEIGKAFTIGIIVFIVRGLIMYLNGITVVANEDFYMDFFYNQIYAVVLYLANAYSVSYMVDKQKEKLFEFKNLLIAFMISVGISMVAIFIIRFCIRVIAFDVSYKQFIATEQLSSYIYSLGISIIITVIFYTIYYFKSRQEIKVKEQKVIAGTASAKFDALKNQLDPHFLFNSLNVLTSLIEENPESAQDFTTALSKVYRYVLEQKNKDLVTVDEELRFAKTYMSLLKMRFEDSIIFDIPEHSTNPESKVVPLSLQLLLENAVKHNIVTSSKPLHIKIYETDSNLVVENNLQTKQILKKSSGVGLNNIKQRYDLLTNKRVRISEDKTQFRVAIPMLTKQITIMKPILREKQLDDDYLKARKHVDDLKGFYYNLMAYVIIIPFLAYINYISYWEVKWFVFSMIGWGIGILFHALQVFGDDKAFGKKWEERKIKEYMKNNKKQF